MSTKYVLVGGYDARATDGGAALCRELVDGFDEPVKLLTCYFAREKSLWNEKFIEEQSFFAGHLPNVRIEFRLADPERFLEQVRWADIVYLHGGTTSTLIAALNKTPDWTKELNGKTVVGSSAGADALVKYKYDLDTLKLGEGLGVLPMKVLVHWQSDYNAPNINWDKVNRLLEEYREDLPLLLLREGEFKVIRQ